MEVVFLFLMLALIGGLGFLVVYIFSKRFCDMCNTSAICRPVNGFNLCRKCAHIAETSSMPIGDLIVQGMAAQGKNGRNASEGSSVARVLAGVVVGVFSLVFFSSDIAKQLPARMSQAVKPPLPVVVTKRPSAVGEGMVLIFDNQTDHQITVGVEVARDGEAVGKWGVTVPPNGSKEFGWAEGWAFNKGDKASLSHPEYRGISYLLE